MPASPADHSHHHEDSAPGASDSSPAPAPAGCAGHADLVGTVAAKRTLAKAHLDDESRALPAQAPGLLAFASAAAEEVAFARPGVLSISMSPRSPLRI